jgi:anti-sigma B factor antagonist
MNLLTEKINDVMILHVKEQRLDAQNSDEFRDRMLQLRENGEINIVVNLEEVRFIDSSGLGKLLSDYKNAIQQNGSLKLAGLQPQLQSIFELTRLHRVFEIYPSVQEALGHD